MVPCRTPGTGTCGRPGPARRQPQILTGAAGHSRYDPAVHVEKAKHRAAMRLTDRTPVRTHRGRPVRRYHLAFLPTGCASATIWWSINPYVPLIATTCLLIYYMYDSLLESDLQVLGGLQCDGSHSAAQSEFWLSQAPC